MDEQQAEDWARLMNANEGVFGSVPQTLDGRARSTSGSNAMRSGDMSPSPVAPKLVSQTNDWPMADNWATRLANCNETTEPGKVNESLSDTLTFLDNIVGNHAGKDSARLLAHFSWNIRARTYKLLRRLSSPWPLLCLMRSLTLDDACHEEREQAIKFARWTMRSGEELWLVTPAADDKMRNACLQTLPRHAALDGPWAISISIASAISHALDKEETRHALTESMGKQQMLTERAKLAAFMMTQFLKSWSGLQYFLADGRKVINALVNALAMLFGLSDDFDSVQFEQQPRFDLPPFAITESGVRTRLLPVDYLRTILLMLFIDEGLVESLVTATLESEHAEVVDAGATLLKWLAQHPHMPLPESYAANAINKSDDRSATANQIICKIEGLPSQQVDAWAASLSSSRLRRQLEPRSASLVAGPKGLAGMSDAQSAHSLQPSAFHEGDGHEHDQDASEGPQQYFGNVSHASALSSPFIPFEALHAQQPDDLTITTSYASSNAQALPVPGMASGTGSVPQTPQTPTAAVQTPMTPLPPMLARTRTKSRSRSTRPSLGVADESMVMAWVQESRVTVEDNPMRWDWAAVRLLINAPLAGARRTQETLRVSGFLPRLARFFHPAALEFCELSRTADNEEYLEIGKQLIRILISSADGLLLIDESRLLSGIVDEIRKQNSNARKLARDESCFSFAKLQMTMAPGYFHFLSEIDHSVGGDTLLERNRLFDAYYQIVELPDQVLLIQYILSSMDYTSAGHARNILCKVAASPHESLRQLVPSFLLFLACDAPCKAGSVTGWAIEVLVQLLFDSSPMVRSGAAQCLVLTIDLARENPHLDGGECDRRIAYLLDMHPMFDLAIINDIRPLVMRVLATEPGFAYLHSLGIVDGEMEAWGALEGILYVQAIELDISRSLAYGPLFSGTPDGMMLMTTSSQTPATPAHFFGELARTQGGRDFLNNHGLPGLLFETLSNIPINSELADDIVALKATLWAIGSVGASQAGYLMLEKHDVIGRLAQIAAQATSIATKGTVLYALALLSRSRFAAEAFRERGWLLCSSCYGTYEFAVPRRLETILNAQGWATGGIMQGTYAFTTDDIPHGGDEELDSVQREIITAVILMSNHVKVNNGSRTLMRLRTSHPHYFRLINLYRRAMKLLGKYRYRMTAPLILDEPATAEQSRASTLQEHSALAASGTVFPRRRMSGLIDDVRAAQRGSGARKASLHQPRFN
ncbi:hypothetical protein DL89DRAFT_268207 [Linderina pennispora]|uniref:ARM repeat-containing protein n=1 Tax=Linderina pennispora TaxID=61395 RepID=A0A1Y1W6L5_9FUNG|nr:uncharacterized protein DL89DRAFT_268207 [Linderina pennispora]ORX69190.1 hypothetical protein DL89DRAFT_268207 [Linderina pennispora]